MDYRTFLQPFFMFWAFSFSPKHAPRHPYAMVYKALQSPELSLHSFIIFYPILYYLSVLHHLSPFVHHILHATSFTHCHGQWSTDYSPYSYRRSQQVFKYLKHHHPLCLFSLPSSSNFNYYPATYRTELEYLRPSLKVFIELEWPTPITVLHPPTMPHRKNTAPDMMEPSLDVFLSYININVMQALSRYPLQAHHPLRYQIPLTPSWRNLVGGNRQQNIGCLCMPKFSWHRITCSRS